MQKFESVLILLFIFFRSLRSCREPWPWRTMTEPYRRPPSAKPPSKMSSMRRRRFSVHSCFSTFSRWPPAGQWKCIRPIRWKWWATSRLCGTWWKYCRSTRRRSRRASTSVSSPRAPKLSMRTVKSRTTMHQFLLFWNQPLSIVWFNKMLKFRFYLKYNYTVMLSF